MTVLGQMISELQDDVHPVRYGFPQLFDYRQKGSLTHCSTKRLAP
jgi:hypothetical protein